MKSKFLKPILGIFLAGTFFVSTASLANETTNVVSPDSLTIRNSGKLESSLADKQSGWFVLISSNGALAGTF